MCSSDLPASPWLRNAVPPQPVIQLRADASGGNRILDLRPGTSSEKVWLWVVQSRMASTWTTRILPGETTSYVFAEMPTDVRVMAVNRVGVIGPVARLVPTQ